MEKVKEIITKIICWTIILFGAVAGMVSGQLLYGWLLSVL
jgi:hypothetical protein